MPYEVLATGQTPAFIIFLLDVSASMSQPLGNKRRVDVVTDALAAALRQMVFRSTKGKRVSPRYRMAMLAYSDKVYDLLDGVKTITDVAMFGVPELSTMRTTDTAKAFRAAEKLLKSELVNIRDWPAPLVCHMTDGQFTGDDPEPVVKRIMEMSVPDGNILVENIFLSDQILDKSIKDPYNWSGITATTNLRDAYAQKLREMSSTLPESYRSMMQESNYHLDRGAKMMLPGMSSELVAMGFQMAAATPIK
jgi:uncharacterized protein YegL